MLLEDSDQKQIFFKILSIMPARLRRWAASRGPKIENVKSRRKEKMLKEEK
jgi:hypothetical protein